MSCILSGEPALAQSVSSTANVPSSTVGTCDDDAPAATPPCATEAHLSKTSTSMRSPPLLEYTHYMARLLATEELTPVSSPGASSTETSPTFKGRVSQASNSPSKF